jgi:hypothetical protein
LRESWGSFKFPVFRWALRAIEAPFLFAREEWPASAHRIAQGEKASPTEAVAKSADVLPAVVVAVTEEWLTVAET